MRGSWRAGAVPAYRFELPGVVTAELLAPYLAQRDLQDVEVLVSELVTNAVRHGHLSEDDTIVVHLAIGADVLRVEVCDPGPGFERPAVLRPRASGGGHGLRLVDRLSASWGVAGDDGTCVWFERVLGSRGPATT